MNWRTLIPARFGGCPAAWKLSRAFVEQRYPEITLHVRGCPRCGPEWEGLARASAVASELPAPRMDEETRQRLQQRLLDEAFDEASDEAFSEASPSAGARRSARAWSRAAVLTLFTCGVAAAAVLASRRLAAPEDHARAASASLASIRAVGAASFVRLQPPPDEIVRLDDGTLEINVAPPSGSRFRISTDDAVIDASEGRFSVEASARTLVAVRVFAGYADVRANGGHAALRPGDEWVPSPSHASPSLASPPVASPAPPHASPPAAPLPPRAVALAKVTRPARLPPTPAEPPAATSMVAAPRRASFERAWRLLRAGDALHAAEAFDNVDKESGGDAISEDALFWEAVAFARAGLAADARQALGAFVARFPRSARMGEASAMLGWMLVDLGDADGARRAFERARDDRVDRVRASAQQGLERLAAPPPR